MVPGAQEGRRSLVIWTIPRHRCGRAKDLASQGTASAVRQHTDREQGSTQGA